VYAVCIETGSKKGSRLTSQLLSGGTEKYVGKSQSEQQTLGSTFESSVFHAGVQKFTDTAALSVTEKSNVANFG